MVVDDRLIAAAGRNDKLHERVRLPLNPIEAPRALLKVKPNDWSAQDESAEDGGEGPMLKPSGTASAALDPFAWDSSSPYSLLRRQVMADNAVALPTLDDAWLKLRWAEQNYGVLSREIKALDERNAHRISVEVDRDAGEYVFRVHDLPDLDPTWGLRIGDCLHNARCALDYLMVSLVALGTGRKPQEIDDIEFPVWPTSKQFNSDIGNWKKPEYQMLAGWLARAEELQPYNAGNPSIWGWSEDGFGEESMPRLPLGLDRLNHLDNIDKHRCVLRPWHGPKLWGGSLGAPPEFRFTGSSRPMDPLVEGAEAGRVRYETPLPFDWVPDQVDMKRNFPIQVSFAEPSIDKSVVRILAWCLWSARATLEIFEPVFTHRKPPLLVTASLAPPTAAG